MSADVNEVARLIEGLGLECHVTETGHEVYWFDEYGVRWSYFGRLYSGRESRLTAYSISPVEAVERATGRKVGP